MKAKKEKKKITLREYHKKRMVTGIAILVTEIFENTAEHYKLDNTTWATVIFVVLAAMQAVRKLTKRMKWQKKICSRHIKVSQKCF